jgi:hypothetical protein
LPRRGTAIADNVKQATLMRADYDRAGLNVGRERDHIARGRGLRCDDKAERNDSAKQNRRKALSARGAEAGKRNTHFKTLPTWANADLMTAY